MSNEVRLSASRISTAQKCSWVYFNKYIEKVPDSSNSGAARGSVCHNIFEYLGKDRHKKHFDAITKGNSISSSKAVHKLVLSQASKQDPRVDNDEDLDLIDKFILNGLNYDFYGDTNQNPFESFSEKVFDLEVNDGDKYYHIYGFIDKLFLYDKGKKAVIRDFKTSKKVYQGAEVTDNLQNLIYCLAVSKLYPKCKNIQTEFLFLNFDLKSDLLGNEGEGVLRMSPMDVDELEGFEYHLTEIQHYLESFDKASAESNFAADQPFPTDKTFSGPLSCGFATKPGQLKKDGTPMWHCHYKFPFDYWALKDSSGSIIKTVQDGEEHLLIPDETNGEYVEKIHYKGCPKFNLSDGINL